MTEPKNFPRLCFVGPMLGRNEGWVKTQGEILADLFTSSGYPVRLTSVIPNRALRMTDIILSLINWRKEIDIVNLSVFSGPGFVASDIASRVAKMLGKPLIFVLRGGNLPDFSMRHPQWVRQVFNRCDALVSPSGFLAHFFREWGFVVKVIPNVISIENYPFRLRQSVQPNLLWMRTFHPIYHPEMAVEVLKLLREKYPKVCLTMAGQEKGLLDSVKSLATQYGLLESIQFAGFLETSGKQREFVAHDIYLHTNRIDNMPVSIVEAAAFGLPVVATAVGGIPYLLEHERTALFVENGDVRGMANAVIRLIEDPSLCKKLSENGRKLAESCSWDNVRLEWENLFEKLLSIPKN